MFKKLFLIATLAAVVLGVLCPVSSGQSDLGSIVGFIRDPSLATVPNATVIVRNESTGVERRTATNDSGYYVVTNIPPGFYSVSVEAKGFKKFETTGNKLDPNAVATINAPLTVGAATETV